MMAFALAEGGAALGWVGVAKLLRCIGEAGKIMCLAGSVAEMELARSHFPTRNGVKLGVRNVCWDLGRKEGRKEGGAIISKVI